MARTIWNGVVLAETSRPVLLEGNVYFPPDDVRHEYLARTRAWSVCPWKGLARYYTVRAACTENKNAAWYYPHPSPLARKIKNHVAFWHGVQVDAGTVSPWPGHRYAAEDADDILVAGVTAGKHGLNTW
jgi:uncharacterized protein (DUF427 family)